MQLENSGFGSVFVCNPETEEDMYRCYSTSCQLWSFVYVDCSLRIDHADISLNIFQVNKFHLKCKLIFKNAPSFRIPIYRKYRLAIYYCIESVDLQLQVNFEFLILTSLVCSFLHVTCVYVSGSWTDDSVHYIHVL